MDLQNVTPPLPFNNHASNNTNSGGSNNNNMEGVKEKLIGGGNNNDADDEVVVLHTYRNEKNSSDDELIEEDEIDSVEKQNQQQTALLPLMRHSQPYSYHKIIYGEGKTFPFGCMVGPDWCCLIVSFVLILTPSIAVLLFVMSNSKPLVSVVLAGSLFFVCLFLCMAAFSNPGILPKNFKITRDGVNIKPSDLPATEPGTGRTLCTKCLVYRPKGAFHCRDCDCCIEELDHHCPWTSHCIGKGNMLYFKAYLSSLVLHIVVVIVSAVLGGQPSFRKLV